MRSVLFALAILVASVPVARAAHPLITEDTGTQGSRHWQLEVFGEEGRERASGARLEQYYAVFSYGIAEHADLQLGLPRLREAASGWGDAALDLKWRFFEKDALSLGLRPGVTLPTGDEQSGLGAGHLGWGTLFILSYEPGPLALHSHLGYKRNRNSLGERESLTHFSVALAYKVAGSLKLVADLVRNSNPDPAASGAERYLVLGAIWSMTKDFDLDVGVKSGHGSAALDEAFLLGGTWRW
jgi:hypothetical protein